MSRLYIFLLAGVGLTISTVGAVFSIAGLTRLFAGAPITVAIMAASLEAAKIVVAGFLYRYWGHINRVMRTYLSTAVVALSMITSLGIFGYLTHAYQISSAGLKAQQMKIIGLKSDNAAILAQIDQIEKFISEVPASRISKKFALYEKSRADVQKLHQQSAGLVSEIQRMELGMIQTQSEIGPLLDVSEALHVRVDVIARILILVFVSVFDPLAICLVFAWGLAIRLRQKYRGNEARIGMLALSKPVDHRFKKSA